MVPFYVDVPSKLCRNSTKFFHFEAQLTIFLVWCGLTVFLQTELFIGGKFDLTRQFRVNKSQKMLVLDIRSELRRELRQIL